MYNIVERRYDVVGNKFLDGDVVAVVDVVVMKEYASTAKWDMLMLSNIRDTNIIIEEADDADDDLMGICLHRGRSAVVVVVVVVAVKVL